MLRSSLARTSAVSAATTSPVAARQAIRASRPSAAATCLYAPAAAAPQRQQRHAHAISNPTLANIEKRWEAMPPQEQADLWMQLRDRMKTPWNEMTLQEKKAGTLATHPHPHRHLASVANMVDSILDCLWPARPTRAATARRDQDHRPVHPCWSRRRVPVDVGRALRRPSAGLHDEQGMAGADERVPEGEHLTRPGTFSS